MLCGQVRAPHREAAVRLGCIINCRGVFDQWSRRQTFRPSVAQCVRAANCVGLVKTERVYGFC